jgi:FecR protein
MNIQCRSISLVAPVALALASWLPGGVAAAELGEAQVTQVVQEVKVVPSGGSARPAAVNETVRKGNAVQTGAQSRSELTFKDQTITRLGEKTIFNVGGEGRTIEMGSGQFLLYVPKKAGGAKIKMGPVTAAITGTTVLGNVNPSGIVTYTVLEGSSCINLPSMGQSLFVQAGQMVVYDPVLGRLENPVDVDLQQQLSSPLVKGFSQLPSAGLIDEAIRNQHLAEGSNEDLENAVRAAGAASISSATPEQFMQAFNSLVARSDPRAINALVARAAKARPDLAPRIVVAAVTGLQPVGVGGYTKGYAKDSKGKEISCDQVQSIVNAAIAADPWMADEIIDAVIQAAPMLADCITRCPPNNAFVPPYVISPLTPQEPVSAEQPPGGGGG